MPVTLAFDIYGTLIDTHGVVGALAQRIGDRATPFSRIWRDKQLEDTFRRGLMRNRTDAYARLRLGCRWEDYRGIFGSLIMYPVG